MLVSTFFELFVDLMEQLVVGGQKPLFCKKIYIIYTIVLETIQMNKKNQITRCWLHVLPMWLRQSHSRRRTILTQVHSNKLHDVMMTQKVTFVAKLCPRYSVGRKNTSRIDGPWWVMWYYIHNIFSPCPTMSCNMFQLVVASFVKSYVTT